jgi:hypothetical protein
MEVFVHASDKVLSNPTLFVKWLDKDLLSVLDRTNDDVGP